MGRFQLTTQVVFVTWARSRVRDAKEFERRLMPKLPEGTQVRGCMEYHVDGCPHFHAVVCFSDSQKIDDAHGMFSFCGDDGRVDTRSIHFELPRSAQNVLKFLRTTQRYCEKNLNKDLFGKRIVPPESLYTHKEVLCGGCKKRIDEREPLFCHCCLEKQCVDKAKVSECSASEAHGRAFFGRL
jgi:hypothetical protein